MFVLIGTLPNITTKIVIYMLGISCFHVLLVAGMERLHVVTLLLLLATCELSNDACNKLGDRVRRSVEEIT